MTFHLLYLERFSIRDKKAGLTEPSGLALTAEGNGFWTVSDDTKGVFRLDLKGKVQAHLDFGVKKTGFEGITLGPEKNELLAVREESNEFYRIDLEKKLVTKKKKLKKMAAFSTIEAQFASGSGNKGLEGLTWNAKTASYFVLKEGRPGLLIEVSTDLETVLSHQTLDQGRGFESCGHRSQEIDFSGLCYDAEREAFWIVSDQMQRLYLYDGARGKVLASAPLLYNKDGTKKAVEKAEGVIYDPNRKRIFIASDKEARIYVFGVKT